MSRRRGALNEWREAVSKPPWTVSVGLAFVAFLVFHLIAASSIQTLPVAHVRDMGSVTIRGYIHVVAAVLQFAAPVIFLTAAAVSLVRRLHSRALLDGARRGATMNLASLSRQDFETLVAEGFRHRGFLVTVRGGGESDGGIDLALARGNERFLVQCKQWSAQSVSVSVVRELHAVMAAEGAVGGFAVTSGTFSMDAKKFASGRNIDLIDGRGLGAFFTG